MRRSERTPSADQLALDGAQAPERLAHRIGGDEPAEALPRVDQALLAEHLEGPADRHPTGAVGRRTARPRWVAADPAPSSPAVDPDADLVGDLLVAGLAHLSYTCLHRVASATTRRDSPPSGQAASPDPTVRARGARHGRRRQHPHRTDQRGVRRASAERRTSAVNSSGRPLTFAEKVLLNHLPRPAAGRRAGQVLQRPRSRSRGHAGRHRPDGAAAVHDRRAARGGGAVDRALRPPDPGPRGRQGRPARRARDQPRGLRLPRVGVGQVRHRLLEARARASSTRSCSSSTPSRAG